MDEIAVMGAGAVGCYYGFKLARRLTRCGANRAASTVAAVERQAIRLEKQQTFDDTFAFLPERGKRGAGRASSLPCCVKFHRHRKRRGGHQAESCAGLSVGCRAKTASSLSFFFF